jgi:hypothetical protein
MIIQKIFSAEDNERIFSVLMTEEEMKLYSSKKKKSQGNRLSLSDQDYLEDIDGEIKSNRWTMPVAGGALGASLGVGAGAMFDSPKTALIGAGIGAGVGAYGMHKVNKKKIEPGLVRDKDKYLKGTKEDRAYYRRKREQQKNREAMIQAGMWAGR